MKSLFTKENRTPDPFLAPFYLITPNHLTLLGFFIISTHFDIFYLPLKTVTDIYICVCIYSLHTCSKLLTIHIQTVWSEHSYFLHIIQTEILLVV